MSQRRRFRGGKGAAGGRLRARALAEAMMDRYADWREACYAVELHYRRWTDAAPGDASPAYARYVAALEREELTAAAYAELVMRFGGRKPVRAEG